MGLNIHSSCAIISPLVLLEEFQSPHYHFTWFHSTHLPPPPTRMDHIVVCELSKKITPGPTTSPFGRIGNRLCWLKLNCSQQEPKLLTSTPSFIKTPTERPASATELSSSLPDIFPGRVKWKHLGTTISDLSSQTGKSTCGFDAGNIYKGGHTTPAFNSVKCYPWILKGRRRWWEDTYCPHLEQAVEPSASLPLISHTAILMLPLLPLQTSSWES